MCGIFGIQMTEESKALEPWTLTELAQLMFPAIRHRGPHAFGWMTWNGGSEVEVVKFPGDVAKNANLKHVVVDDSALWMVGHVRWATHGDVKVASNNHPIIHHDIIGVHNGVLSNHREILSVTGRYDKETEVDSEAIFAAVNLWGHRAGLRAVHGDMVTVYTSLSKPENLWFGRSFGRSLVFARTKAGSLVWASELKVLTAVYGHELTHVRELKENQLLRATGGKVVEQAQYRKPPAKAPVVSGGFKWRPGVRPGRNGGTYDPVRGITDRMAQPQEPIGPERDGDEVLPGLFWVNGKLVDEQEYIDLLEEEMSIDEERMQ